MVNSLYKIRLHGIIMVVVFTILDWKFVSKKATTCTMIPFTHISWSSGIVPYPAVNVLAKF